MPIPQVIKNIIERARQFNLEARPYYYEEERISHRYVWLEKKKLFVSFAKKSNKVKHPGENPRFMHVVSDENLSTDSVAGGIFVQIVRAGEWRFFIIPIGVLRKTLLPRTARRNMLLFPLFERPLYQNSMPRMNVWEYLDQWHKALEDGA